MSQFQMQFSFEHRHYEAEVSVIRHKDHTQYAISPKDEKLLVQYGTQVIHVFPGKPVDIAFPGTTDEKTAYSSALAAGLRKHLQPGTII